jgi:hypothetical protein
LPAWRPGTLRPSFLPGGREVVVYDDDGHSSPEFRRVEVETGRWHHDLSDARIYAAAGPSVSRDGRLMVLTAANPFRTFYSYRDLWLYDRVSHELKRLTSGLRAASPNLSPDGKRVVFEVNDAASRGLGLYDLERGTTELVIPPAGFEHVYTPVFSPDGRTVAFSWWKEGGYRDLWTIDLATRALTRLTADRAIDMEPRYSPDGRWLYFVSDRTGVHNLYAYELATGKVFQATNLVNGLFDPDISPDGKRVVFSGFRAEGYTLEVAELEPSRFVEAAPALLDRLELPPPAVGAPRRSHAYNPLLTALPWTLLPYAQPDGYGELIGLKLHGADAVGHHDWTVQLAFGTGRADDVNFSANYSYSGLWPTLSIGTGHALLKKSGLVIDGKDLGYDEDDWTFGTSLSLPILRRGLGAADLSFSYNLASTRNVSAIPPPDPSALVSRLPDTGRTAGLALSFSYSDLRRHKYSISTARGRSIGLDVSVGSKYLGSQHEVYAASWRWQEHAPMPWRRKGFEDHVLYLAYSGGIAGGDPSRRGFYYLGGYPPQDLLKSIYDFSRPGSAALRGYGYAAQSGDQFHVVNLEYRFPIAWIEWGYEHFPLYLRRLHAKAFVDYGGAFTGPFRWDNLRVGVGGELILELTYAWYYGAALQLGYAYGASAGGSNQVYFLLNSPF